MPTMPQNPQLLKHLLALLEDYRAVFKQTRSYQRAKALVLAELLVFARHTVSQLIMVLGMSGQDWAAWYRFFSQGRFDYDQASRILFRQTLAHVDEQEVYVLAGDSTQTPRSSLKMEGVSWLRNLRTPPFMVGIHAAQRWFNGSWLMPQAGGYSRALPIRWLPAFTEKAKPRAHEPKKEWQAALDFLNWVLEQLRLNGREQQPVLMVADGSYDHLKLWQNLPKGVVFLARSAKNRVLHYLPDATMHGNRKYGPRAPSPQQVWQARQGWRQLVLEVRGRSRHLRYQISGPLVRHGAPQTPLILITVRGKKRQGYRRDPLPFLVNAVQDEQGHWVLPLPVETLLFWAWQRWEVEVCHRELKANFGLGDKQCFNPHSAVVSVQWSAWVYALLLLAGYRAWGLRGGPAVPTRWWRGSGRWSLNTLWRAYRHELWQCEPFQPLYQAMPDDWAEKDWLTAALRNVVVASARA